MFWSVRYVDHDGTDCLARFSSEYAAILFCETLDAEGIEHQQPSLRA